MKVSTNSVRITLWSLLIALLLISSQLYPKLAGPLSGLGNAMHETRVEVLGADDFRTPERRLDPKSMLNPETVFPYLQYRVCDTCPIPMMIGAGFKVDQIRIMNIQPRYQFGMELPAGDYDIELDYGSPKKTYRETVSLIPANNVFLYERNRFNSGEVYRAQR